MRHRISMLQIVAILSLIFLYTSAVPVSSLPQPSVDPLVLDTHTHPFTDVTARSGIDMFHTLNMTEPSNTFVGVGNAFGDVDRDGDLDIYLTSGDLNASNKLYLNNGDGTFMMSPFSSQVSLADHESGSANFVDYDNDGWLDLYVGNLHDNALFRNMEGMGFEDVTIHSGVGDRGKTFGTSWGDFDGDGWLDLYVANHACDACPELGVFIENQDRLYRNNGDGTFSDYSSMLKFSSLLGSGFIGTFVDYDNDGDQDIYVVNDKVYSPIGNVLWRNDGAGCGGWCFTDVSKESGADITLFGMGLASGDYDNDGDIDFYFSNIGEHVLLENNGDGTFSDRTFETKTNLGDEAFGWGCVFFDYNNDGWLDLFVALVDRESVLFTNNGDGTFTDAEQELHGKLGHGVATGDFNNDGWVDLLVGPPMGNYYLLENQGYKMDYYDNKWLSFDVMGDTRDEEEIEVNRDGVGARITVRSELNGVQRVQMQEVKQGDGLGGGSDMRVHFGLGDYKVTEVTIRWTNGEEHVVNVDYMDQYNGRNNEIEDYNGFIHISYNDRMYLDSGFSAVARVLSIVSIPILIAFFVWTVRKSLSVTTGRRVPAEI